LKSIFGSQTKTNTKSGGQECLPHIKFLALSSENPLCFIGYPITCVTCIRLTDSASFRTMSERKAPSGIRSRDLRFQFEIEREDDGRWIAEIPEIPGAMAYGDTEEQAKAKAYALALYAVADDVERSNNIPDSISILRVPA
jgi:predicted RNase H-like HicB family nuclease